VHQHTLGRVQSLFYEFENGIGGFILDVKHNLNGPINCPYLVVLVQPEECEISDPDRLPVIGDLLASAVDNMRDFVSDDELQVLRSVSKNLGITWLASSSPMKRPSLILMAPIMSCSNICGC